MMKSRPWSLYGETEDEHWQPGAPDPDGWREVLKQLAAVLLALTLICGAIAVVASLKP